MVVVPALTAVASPSVPDVLEIVAMLVSEDFQTAVVVTSFLVPSEKMAIAVYCWVAEMARDVEIGVTSTVVMVAPVTVSLASPLEPMYSAEMVALPVVSAVVRPSLPAVVDSVAMLSSEDFHVASFVTSFLVPSEKRAVAVYCWVAATARDVVAGVTSTDVTVVSLTVSWASPLLPLYSAEMVAVPSLTPVARPSLPAVMEIVATAASEEAQVASFVTSCLVPSEKRAVAVYCCVADIAMDDVAGETSTEVRVASVTVKRVSALNPW